MLFEKTNSIKKRNLQRATLGSVFIAALLFPLSTALSNIALGVLLATTVYSFIINGLDFSLFRQRNFYVFSPLLFFLLTVVGILYSPFDQGTFKEVKRMLFMLALPALALRRDLNPQATLASAATGLLIGSLGSALLLLATNIFKIASGPVTWYSIFSYTHTSFNFTSPLGLHPIYLGSYYVLALVFIFTQTIILKRGAAIIGTVILLLALLFLNSRIIYGVTLFILLIFSIKNFHWKGFLLLITGLTISFFLLFSKLSNTYLFDKLVHGTQWELSTNVGAYNTDQKHPADSRFSRWEVAWELIRERPLWGYGTGSERRQLAKKFKAYQMQVSYESRYNAHNQFIGFGIRFGLVGLLSLIIYFVGNFSVAFRDRNTQYNCFLLLIFSIFLVENYIDRNMGIIFIALFGTLFYLQSSFKNRKTDTHRL